MKAANAKVRKVEPLQFEVFAAVPPGFLAHAVTDRRCEPMFQPGEVAVALDQPQIIPEAGGWYLVEFTRGKTYQGRELRERGICEVHTTEHLGEELWWYRSPAQPGQGELRFSDGPYPFVEISERILGPIVGIYRPSTPPVPLGLAN